MAAPFIFGRVAEGHNFIDRENDTERLAENFKSLTNTILISPRRWGKTSLVHKAAAEPPKNPDETDNPDEGSAENPENPETPETPEQPEETPDGNAENQEQAPEDNWMDAGQLWQNDTQTDNAP